MIGLNETICAIEVLERKNRSFQITARISGEQLPREYTENVMILVGLNKRRHELAKQLFVIQPEILN